MVTVDEGNRLKRLKFQLHLKKHHCVFNIFQHVIFIWVFVDPSGMQTLVSCVKITKCLHTLTSFHKRHTTSFAGTERPHRA